MDFSSIFSAVDFLDVAAAILAIAGLMIVPGIVVFGARMVLGFISGGPGVIDHAAVAASVGYERAPDDDGGPVHE